MLRLLFGKDRGSSRQLSGKGARITDEPNGIRLHFMASKKLGTNTSSSAADDRVMASYEIGLDDEQDSVKSGDHPKGIMVKQEWEVTTHTKK